MKLATLEARRARLRDQLGKLSDVIAKAEDRARILRQVLFQTERALDGGVSRAVDETANRYR